jgi:chemotaxis protein CheC
MTQEGTPEQEAMIMDGLREIGSIGAAHASSALSQLVHKDILVEVSECFVCTTQELPTAFPNTEEIVVAVFLEAIGKSKGGIMLVVSQDMAIDLADMILGRDHDAEHSLDVMDQDAICEIGNICASAYLNAVSKFTDITTVPSPPGVAVDMLQAILEFPAALVEAESDSSVVIKTHFVYGKEVLFGFMLYIPDHESQMVLMQKFSSM